MRKRWLLGAISGFFFGLALSIILLGLHVVKLDSVVLTLLPVLGIVLGVVLALWGPRRPNRAAVAPVARPPDTSAPAPAWPEEQSATPAVPAPPSEAEPAAPDPPAEAPTELPPESPPE